MKLIYEKNDCGECCFHLPCIMTHALCLDVTAAHSQPFPHPH